MLAFSRFCFGTFNVRNFAEIKDCVRSKSVFVKITNSDRFANFSCLGCLFHMDVDQKIMIDK